VLPDLPLPAFNTRELPFSLVAVRRTRHAIAMWCCLMELAKKNPEATAVPHAGRFPLLGK
jgi:hypothetical protein